MTAVPERLAQAVAERVVALVVDALDVNAILARVDVEALLERIDVDALLARVDLDELLARVDLSAALAPTATSAAQEALDAVRRTSRRGDDITARMVERVIRR